MQHHNIMHSTQSPCTKLLLRARAFPGKGISARAHVLWSRRWSQHVDNRMARAALLRAAADAVESLSASELAEVTAEAQCLIDTLVLARQRIGELALDHVAPSLGSGSDIQLRGLSQTTLNGHRGKIAEESTAFNGERYKIDVHKSSGGVARILVRPRNLLPAGPADPPAAEAAPRDVAAEAAPRDVAAEAAAVRLASLDAFGSAVAHERRVLRE